MSYKVENQLSNIAHYVERYVLGVHCPAQRELIATSILSALISSETIGYSYASKEQAVSTAIEYADLLIEKLKRN